MTKRAKPGPGQESVWDYPRPPTVKPSDEHVVIEFDGEVLADTRRALRVLETSHPPTYYIPKADVDTSRLRPATRRTMCEFKGQASYYDLVGSAGTESAAAWEYADPRPGFESLRDHLCFYPSRMDRCMVDGETVEAQEGDFYGGWITSKLVGPFKGGAGTWGW